MLNCFLPGDLTFADVHTSFGHEAHPSLGLLGAEGAQVVDIRGLICDLKVTDAAVPLQTNAEMSKRVIVNSWKCNGSAHLYII